MPIVSGGGGGGNTTGQVAASGKVLPVALAGGGTVDSTTYADTAVGSGFFTTLVLANNRVALALARSGDAHPKLLLASTTSGLLSATDGSADPWNSGAVLGISANSNASFAWNLNSFTAGSYDPNVGSYDGTANATWAVGGRFISFGTSIVGVSGAGPIGGSLGDLYVYSSADPASNPVIVYVCTTAGDAQAARWRPLLSPASPYKVILSGALPTVALASGTGAQVFALRDVETVTPFSGDGTNNAATCAIALSPDNVTYSTLATISIAAALNLTGVLTDNVNVRVPAGWYIKLTAVHGTLGLTTYY